MKPIKAYTNAINTFKVFSSSMYFREKDNTHVPTKFTRHNMFMVTRLILISQGKEFPSNSNQSQANKL